MVGLRTDSLVVPPSRLPSSPAHWHAGGAALPPQDSDALCSLALSAGWNLRILDAPLPVSRKCPVLPAFVPRSVPQGLAVVGGQDIGALFHGFVAVDNRGAEAGQRTKQPAKCPYHYGNQE